MTRLPPGPSSPPHVQLARWLLRPTQLMDACHRRYGEAFTMRVPAPQETTFVLFTDPAVNRQIFTASSELMSGSAANEVLRPFVGSESIFLLDGERHIRERRLIMPPFHGKRMRAYAETMRDVTARVVASWRRGRRFAIHPELQRITLEVIIRTVMGFDPRADGPGNGANGAGNGANRGGNGTNGASGAGALFDEIHDLLGRATDAASKPWLLLPPLQRDLGPLSPWGRFERLRARADDLVLAEIERRRREDDVAGRDDILSMLMQARDEDGNPMSDEQLRDEMRSLLVAGNETTATALAWFFDLVLGQPDVHRALVAEVRQVVGDRPLVADHLPELTYLDAAIKESMRLRPVVPLAGRVLRVDQEVGGYELPAGTAVCPTIYLTHRRSDIYPQPTAFRPERWLGEKPDPYAFYPFGGGQRRCAGMVFALYEMKVVIAQILATVDLRRAARKPCRVVRRGVTLAPSRGMPVVAADPS